LEKTSQRKKGDNSQGKKMTIKHCTGRDWGVSHLRGRKKNDGNRATPGTLRGLGAKGGGPKKEKPRVCRVGWDGKRGSAPSQNQRRGEKKVSSLGGGPLADKEEKSQIGKENPGKVSGDSENHSEAQAVRSDQHD